MNKKIGFIGCGSMAKAMIGGIMHSKFTDSSKLYVSNPSMVSLDEVKTTFNINISNDNLLIAKECDIIFLTVKPHIYPKVIDEIKNQIKEDAIVVMVAPGQSFSKNEKMFGRRIKLVRAMPNTPALVKSAMTAISFNEEIADSERVEIKSIFECFGIAEIIDEELMNVATGVSGSSPAYAFMFIEALADGAVLSGMPRKQAYTFASQALLGAAKMVLETGIHPGNLKDMVCSPGGTTIEAVKILEENGFRSAIIEAVEACVEKAKSME